MVFVSGDEKAKIFSSVYLLTSENISVSGVDPLLLWHLLGNPFLRVRLLDKHRWQIKI
jgi:hypothetical protein